MASKSADLRRRVLLVGAPLAVLAVATAAVAANRIATLQFERSTARAVTAAALRTASTVDLYLQERHAAVRMLAGVPTLVERARRSGIRAVALGLDGRGVDDLERAFQATRMLEPEAQVNAFLARVRDDSDFVELIVTDRHGFTVAASNPTSDFVQADEAWWQRAFELGDHQDAAEFDESAGATAVGLSVRIEDPGSGERLGVLKAVLDLSRLVLIISPRSDTTTIQTAVVDSAARVVASRDVAQLLGRLPGADSITLGSAISAATIRRAGAPPERVATTPINRAPWWVVAREPVDVAAGVAVVRRVVILAAAGLLVLIIVVIYWLSMWLNRRVTQPVRAAGDIATRVAGGDLSVSALPHHTGAQEVSQLLSSVESMVTALRQLVGQIRSAAQDSAAMAQEISASTEEMSASTQEMAHTCQSLTEQATQEAETLRAAAVDASRILEIATALADGASEAASRSTQLATLAARHREELTGGAEQLTSLAADLERGAADAEVLAKMSEEVQHFVKQAKDIGAQTNMLALNAAIEASRAGAGESRGFAVVADEVRKLATQASRAATTTAETVRNVLTTLEATRERLTRLVGASASVRRVAESAVGGLEEVVGAARDTSRWTEEISSAATELRRLVEEITQRLDVLAQGTEGVVAAAEEIAASAQQQSASTQEIASSASQLAESAERLTAAVSSFRIQRESGRLVRSGVD